MRQDKAGRGLSMLDSPYFVPLCFAVYLALRFAIIVLVPIEQHSDQQWYFNRAVAIAAGQGYSEQHVPTAYWPVGWPGFLGIVFWLFAPSPFVGQMVNWLSSAATFVLTLRLGTTLFRDERVGRLGVLLLTVCPNQIAYVPILGTEVFYTALLLFAIDVLVSADGQWRWIVAGVVFGAATLTKAQTLVLPAILFGGWWIASARSVPLPVQLGRAIAVYVAMAVVILPWTARNYYVLGAFVPISTNGGLALLTGNNPSARGDFTPNDALVQQVPRGVAEQVAADHLANALALNWIRQHPRAVIALLPEKIWRLWGRDGEAEWAYQEGYPAYDAHWQLFRAVRVVNQIYYLALILLSAPSAYYWYRARKRVAPEMTTGYILIFYTTLISVVFSGQSRFHFPMMPWIAMYAAWTIVQWTQPQPVRSAAA